MSAPNDQRVRERIRADLGTTLVIEAAAGTGKTTELVNRIVAVIASGRGELAKIVAVTFTEKAAGELKLRIRAEIERARRDFAGAPDVRARLDGALRQLEEARIGTIHSFCADLLRERPVEARVDPMFEVAPDEIAAQMFEAAFDRWFEQVLANPSEGMRRLLRRREGANEGPRAIARRAAWDLIEWRDFDAPWAPVEFDRDRRIDELVGEIVALGKLAGDGQPDDYLARSLDEISRPLLEAVRLESVRGRDYDGLEAVLLTLARAHRHWDWRGFGRALGAVPYEEVIRSRAGLHARLEAFRADAGANLAPLLQRELRPVVGYYEDLKRRAGRVDFLDLLLMARNLVRDNSAVRAELQRRFTHIFIDEFQDTDPLQAEILLLLAGDAPAESNWLEVRPAPGKLFIVGDPKQSIYRFRRADVALYQGVKRRLVERGADLEYLTVSFRATPGLQQMVNAAFAPQMETDTETQPRYAPLEPARSDCGTQPPIVALPVPAPYAEFGRVTDRAIDESLPDAIAAFARWLLQESGWTVTERDAPETRVAIRPRHICILFRRLNSFGRDVTRPYIRALEARHLPHVLVKGGSFNQREEVEALRNLLGAIERPDDELLVFAALRGPVFALSDAQLLEFSESLGTLHPFRKLAADIPERLGEVARALAVLRDLHRGRNRRPIAETIARLLNETRAHAGIAIWPTGEQALANVMRVMDQARRYDARSGATSFRGFVDELEDRAEREEAGDVPVVEEGTEGIRIMTVHRAKGLEYPIVILADLTCNETASEPSRHADPARRLCALRLAGAAPAELRDHADEERRRDQEEAVRVLYVAATRARDLLVVPALGDGEYDGWLRGLSPVVYPVAAERRTPLTRQPPGCPEFGIDTTLVRPERAQMSAKSVAPGLHRADRAEQRVVWWDPSRLILNVTEAMGLRQTKLLEIDQAGQVSERGTRAYAEWRDQRRRVRETGAAPALKVATATELAAAAGGARAAPAGAIRIEEVPRDAARPHGARFGTLVHSTMLRVPFDAGAEQIRRTAAIVGRMLGASDDEVAAAAAAVVAALGAPAIAIARDAPDARRECPLLLKLDDGTIVEGVADLAYLSGRGAEPRWTVVDFKTDLDLAARINEYRAQLALYMRAIRAGTGIDAEGVILWI
jgi:ATP-dependent helicase/nuclease subunit A